VADVLELALDRRARHHGEVWVAPLQRLHARLLVEAEDVLVGRGARVHARRAKALAEV
jgi:hypothetical protein